MITIEAHYSENLTFLLALLTVTPVRLLECSEFFGNFAIDDSFILCMLEFMILTVHLNLNMSGIRYLLIQNVKTIVRTF